MDELPTEIVARLRALTPDATGKSHVWGRAMKEAADEIGRLRDVVEKVAMHKPGTPGLHYDNLEQLIASATGIAEQAITWSRE